MFRSRGVRKNSKPTTLTTRRKAHNPQTYGYHLPHPQDRNNTLRDALAEVYNARCDEAAQHTAQMWEVLDTIWQARYDADMKGLEIEWCWGLNAAYGNHPLNDGRFATLEEVEEWHNYMCDRSEREYWDSVDRDAA